MQFALIDWLGVIGGATLLFAFARISLGKWKNTSLWYELDNLIAAVLLSVYSYSKGAYVSLVINTVWAVVALRGVTSFAERRQHAKKHR